jgi:D-alanyl-D-alanine carboxypeptidase
MFSKLFASFLITFSVFLGAQMSHKYPDFFLEPNSASVQAAATLGSNLSDENRRNIPSILPFFGKENKMSQLEPIPLQRLPESEDAPSPDITAKAAIAVTKTGRILFQKNINQSLPIASLTKLLTALVVIDKLPLSENVKISKTAVDTYGEMGNLVVNEEISVEGLLYIMLMDSSNDAAVALSEAVNSRLSDGTMFPELMNVMARKIGLINSRFSDPAGLNPDNISTASDLVKLIAADLDNPLIKKILGTEEIDVFSINNRIKHHLKNTNKLLNKTPGVIGGKTGYTEEAGECMILIAEAPQKADYFTVVLLGSNVGMRFIETDKIVEWTRQHYGW